MTARALPEGFDVLIMASEDAEYFLAEIGYRGDLVATLSLERGRSTIDVIWPTDPGDRRAASCPLNEFAVALTYARRELLKAYQ
jgi:hypothetical protein